AGSFCGETGLRKVGLGGIHPLTQRYVLRSKVWKQRKYQREMNH
ncbi:VOC family protein, partial [Vibrio vulnificus]